MTQLKMNIKIHLHYIYRCNSFSVFAEEEVNEDKFVVIMDEYDEGGWVLAQFHKKCMLESINKCKQCNYVGPYKY